LLSRSEKRQAQAGVADGKNLERIETMKEAQKLYR